ncbi:MAG: bestrophin family ion channel [Cyanobacteriota bacterium]|nr:bestrophin family ion channel [Cyanobacteriota bacterium]
MARRHYPRVLIQLLWRLRLDLLVMAGVCLLAALPSGLLKRDFVGQSPLESILGIAVSVFLAFRNTQAINRWWEARGHWGGLVNQSLSWRDLLMALLGSSREQRRDLQRLLQLQVLAVWLVNFELRTWARADLRTLVLAMADRLGFAPSVTLQQVSLERAGEIQRLSAQGALSDMGRDALLRSVVDFNNALGGLQKIRNTPIPQAYDAFVRLIVWLFGFELYLDGLFGGFVWLGVLLFAAFLVAERIGAYVECPFDRDPGSLSLPLNQICLAISQELLPADHPLAAMRRCQDPSIWN